MTDEEDTLAPVPPVGPKRRVNPQMAQPTAPQAMASTEPGYLPATPADPPMTSEADPPEIAAVPKVAAAAGAARSAGASANSGSANQSAPATVGDVVAHADWAWSAFRDVVLRFPSERLDEHLGEGWSRKQMLAHIAAWHDYAASRLLALMNTGAIAPLDQDADAFNARVARQAVGRTSGEVLKELDATYSRLHRQLARMTDEQLAFNDGWAVSVVAGNTWEHYQEHWADIWTPELAPGEQARR